MNEHLNKILRKTYYVVGESERINNRGFLLLESKKTELEATNKLKKQNIPNPDGLVNQFKDIDTSKNQILLPVMATAYIENNKNINQIKSIFGDVSKLINKNKIKTIGHNKNGYFINGKEYRDFLGFSEAIHALVGADTLSKGSADAEAELVNNDGGIKPIWENETIAIYDGNNIESCIRYGKGELTGKQYSFCIGQYGSSNMWQGYRDNNNASFYYILDKTKKTNDPFHIVVWMNTDYGVLLTHEPNNTQDEYSFDSSYAIKEFNMGYRDYLKKNNVPIEKILIDIPKTEEEENKNNIIGKANESLDWFKNLGKLAQKNGLFSEMTPAQATFKMMSDYIGRGHLLSLEQFQYLFNMRNPITGGAFKLLKKYLDTGQSIPSNQFDILTNG